VTATVCTVLYSGAEPNSQATTDSQHPAEGWRDACEQNTRGHLRHESDSSRDLRRREPGFSVFWARALHGPPISRLRRLFTSLEAEPAGRGGLGGIRRRLQGDAARDDEFIRSSLEAPAAAALCETPYERNPFCSLAVAEACDGRGAANYCAKVVGRSRES
jgi:hypothetical protein